jgi:hypothetical protein
MFGVESAYRRIKGACNHPGLLSRTSSPKNPTGFPFFAGRASALVQSDAHGSKVGCRIRGFDCVKVCKVKVIVQKLRDASRAAVEKSKRDAKCGRLHKNVDLTGFAGACPIWICVFPSETDTLRSRGSGGARFGRAVVSAVGRPKYNVQHCKTGYIANNFEEFVAFTDLVLTQPDLLPAMATAGRLYALSTSWERSFDGICKAYEQCFYGTEIVWIPVFSGDIQC